MRTRGNRGFTLLTTVLLVSVATMAAVVLISTLREDVKDGAQYRRAREARIAAEGGLMEMLNDRGILDVLPTPESPTLVSTYSPGSDSRFERGATAFGDIEYTATVRLVRMAPMLESSHTAVRAVMYEIDIESLANGATAAGVEAEVYRVASAKVGVVRPRMHAR